MSKCGCRKNPAVAKEFDSFLASPESTSSSIGAVRSQESGLVSKSMEKLLESEGSKSQLIRESPLKSKSQQASLEKQHQLIVNKLHTTLKATDEYPKSRSKDGVPYRRIQANEKMNPLDIANNQSSSINNWLDDQLKRERRNSMSDRL